MTVIKYYLILFMSLVLIATLIQTLSNVFIIICEISFAE